MDQGEGQPTTPTIIIINAGERQQQQQQMSRRTFPHRLHDILAQNDSQVAMSWNEQGDAFYIHDAQALTEILLGLGMSGEFRSFQRQLNLYGFSGTRTDGISHPHFRRDTTDNLHLMTRRQQGGAAFRTFHRQQAPARPQFAGGTSLSQGESSAALATSSEQPARPGAALATSSEQPARPGINEEGIDEETRILRFFLDCDITRLATTSNRPLTPAEIAIYNRRWDSNCNKA